MERTDAERWVDAESILDGNPTEFALHQVRRYRRLMRSLIWSLLCFFVIAFASGVVAVIFLRGHAHHTATPPRTPAWQEITGLSVTVAGIVLLAVALVRYFRSGAWGEALRSPAIVLTWQQRRELSAQIRGRTPLNPGRVRLARGVAELADRSGARKFLTLLLIGIVLELIGQLITTPSAGRFIYTGAMLIFYAVGVVFAASRQRQVRAFLEQTRSIA